jgi:methyl-accepting chemotaxis protein
MKKPLSSRIIGLTLMILSILGMLFSISGIVAVWVIYPRIRDSASEILDSFETAIMTSQDAFDLSYQAIEDLLLDFGIIKGSFDSLDTTLEGVSGSLDTSANLIGDNLKQTVIDTQTALESAASTAVLIDNTLDFLSRIPLLGVDYDPEVPLHISLEQVANNLEKFPDALDTIEGGITKTTDGLGALQINLSDLNNQIQEFSDDLEQTQVVILKFSDNIDVIKTQLMSLNDNLGLYLTLFSLFISGLLFWSGLSQLIILNQGYIYLKGETILVNLTDIERK